MGRSVKLFTLDDGQKLTIKEIMELTGCKDSAVRHRLAQCRDADKILAPKGTHKDYGYGQRGTVKKAKNIKTKVSKIAYLENKKERKAKAEKIKKNHPFYDTGAIGKLNRLLWGKW
jgi:hypothetical protein